jgi:hypothetical protein
MNKSILSILRVAYDLYEKEYLLSFHCGMELSYGKYADTLIDECLTLLGVDEEIGAGIFVRDMFTDPIYEAIPNIDDKDEERSFAKFIEGVNKCLSMFASYRNSDEYHGCIKLEFPKENIK